MRYLLEKKTRVERRAKKKADRKAKVPFEKQHKLNWSKGDPLKDREDSLKRSVEFNKDRKRPRPPMRTLDRIRVGKGRGHGTLRMSTPKAREAEKKYRKMEGFFAVAEVLRLHEADSTSELEKRCIADVMAKSAKGPDGKPVKGARNRLSRAYAICRASLQKSGRYKKGTADLTKKGSKISGAKAKKKDHGSKVSRFEKHVVAARKKK